LLQHVHDPAYRCSRHEENFARWRRLRTNINGGYRAPPGRLWVIIRTQSTVSSVNSWRGLLPADVAA